MDVLLMRLGGLGDLLVAAPAMAYLRRTMPGRGFRLVCRGGYGELMRDAGLAETVLAAEGREASRLFARGGEGTAEPQAEIRLAVGWMQKPPPPELKEALRSRGFDTVWFLAPDLRGESPLAGRFFEAARAAFPPLAGAGPSFDACARLRSVLGGAMAARSLIRPDLPARGAFAVIHPGSGGRSKLWPLDGFLEVVRRAADSGIPGVVATGDVEETPEVAGRLERAALPRGWSWARRPPLLALTGLLAEEPRYLGNDSGVTHLAAACGARVTAIFPETSRPEWEPYGRSHLLSAADLGTIDVDRVWAAFRDT
jgi:heptosyltransferase III